MSRADDGQTLKNKVFLVTGAGRGLGAALVRAAAEQRARVVINCRVNQKCAESLAVEITTKENNVAQTIPYDRAAFRSQQRVLVLLDRGSLTI